jgi:hypothetical protein
MSILPTATSNIQSEAEVAAYLRTLPAIRERCSRVHALAQEGKLQYFDYHPAKEADVAQFCESLMKVISLLYRFNRCANVLGCDPARLLRF